MLFLFSINIYSLELRATAGKVFNIQVLSGSELLRTTYANVGYSSYLRVDGQSKSIDVATATFNGIQFTVSHEIKDGNSRIDVIHNIQNLENTQKTIDLADHCDSQLGSDDRPIIDMVHPNNAPYTNQAYLYIHSSSNYFYIFLKGIFDPPYSSAWFGQYSARTSYLWQNATVQTYSGGDSGLVYSWQNVIVPPMGLVRLTSVFSVRLIVSATPSPTPFPTATVAPEPDVFICGDCPKCPICPNCPNCPECHECPPQPKCPDCQQLQRCPTPCPKCPICPNCDFIDVNDDDDNENFSIDDDEIENLFFFPIIGKSKK
ncbi:hypothetical protein TRFO_16050 [Tritrichomonas foetus]|uniref:Uncharacterized protein n=1 Tax=Tritrichomonas foetus TaxID=1144522 RepID=A0A1J4KR40_9EUKA|nr:hypothetical protein TRFO_16050 [Tritrichomonas foetus]|eukprot:OHT13727.1 hypothetical protein TRFO_16050 [Tritrichomonas foetus]